jgi:hypothetical protein
MTMRTLLPFLGTLSLLAGCASAGNGAPAARSAASDTPARARVAAAVLGTASPEADKAPAAPATGAATETPAEEPLPSACSAEGSIKDTKACLPPTTFAKKLCGGSYPEVALSLFAKGTPWTRVWLAGDVDAWNASGKGLTHRAKLAFDEEVIVLSRHGAASTGGIVMTGAQASFEVVRSDGTCVSVMEGEITTKRPPAPKPASVPWTRLEEGTRKALLASPKVKTSLDALAKACANASTDRKACDKADRTFSASVLDTVRAGATLPLPSRRP